MCQWFDSTPNHESTRNYFSRFSSKDLEGIKIFLIFNLMDSGSFCSGGSPYSPTRFLLRFINEKIVVNKTRGVFLGCSPYLDLDTSIIHTSLLDVFRRKKRQRSIQPQGSCDLPVRNITHIFSTENNTGEVRRYLPFFMPYIYK